MKNWSFGKLLGVFGGGFVLLMVIAFGVIMAVAKNKNAPAKKAANTQQLAPIQTAAPNPRAENIGIEGQLDDSDERKERKQISEDIKTLAANQQLLNDSVNAVSQKVDAALATPGSLAKRGNPYEVRKIMVPSLPRESRLKKVALPAGAIKLTNETGWDILAIAQGKAFLENKFGQPLTVSKGDFIPPSENDESLGYLIKAIDPDNKIIWVSRVTEK